MCDATCHTRQEEQNYNACDDISHTRQEMQVMDSGSVMDYSCDVSMDYFTNVAGGRSVLGQNYG